MIMTALMSPGLPTVFISGEDLDTSDSEVKQIEFVKSEGNGFVPASSIDALSCDEQSLAASIRTVSGATNEHRGLQSSNVSQTSMCLLDPLADEAERRSVLHYDLCYKKERTRGQVTFALRYDYIHRMLMVHLIRAQNLKTNDPGRLPNPYVKAYLLQERHHYCRSRIHKKTENAEFNEVFSFEAPVDGLASRMLQLTVYDYERIKRHDIIGNVIMRDLLEKSDLSSWTEYTMHVVDNDKKDDYGDILLYLNFNKNDEKLHFTVARAYNLRPMDITGASDPYVKIIQLNQRKRVKKRKTSIKRANLHPVYNENLTFDLPRQQIRDTSFLVKVMDWDRIGSDDLLGCCIIGSESVTKEGREQWERCVLQSSEESNNCSQESLTNGMWHSLLPDVPEDFCRLPNFSKEKKERRSMRFRLKSFHGRC
ncbi:Synaptotagmin-C [Trichinella papuae]|uniref:Synaptotagmin-C n=1 Tax=Trichinella papuae TaxID=268474 RepID=A0A0V1N7Z9_9BILA|nr:Synaptotagmin-C [Trichinella papuae]KRZ80181.1 Synaptotagmin-C [Trichinella papuae]KRZ80183.1 Synaptotagmin-C [Trichinella papuae]